MSLLWLLLALWTSATAPPDARAGVVVVPQFGTGVPSGARERIMAALRDEVELSRMFRWAGPAALGTDELMVTLGCESLDEPCLRRASTQLNAPVLLVVLVESEGGLRARLRVLHARSTTGVREHFSPLGNPAADLPVLRTALSDLLHRGVAGRLEVASDPSGADVLVDGTPAGRTPLELVTLAPGRHHLHVVKQGFDGQEADVDVGAADARTFHAVLRPKGRTDATPVPVASGPSGAPSRLPTLAVWSGAVALGVVGAAAVVVGALGIGGAGGVYAASHDPAQRSSVINRNGLGALKQAAVYGGAGAGAVMVPGGLLLWLAAAALGVAGVALFMRG